MDENATITPLVKYEVSIADIRAMGEKYALLKPDSKEGYEEVRLAIGTLRSTRVAIEARRKALKRSALDYERAVDKVAKELIAAIEAIEDPLQRAKDAVDDEKERIKREKAEAEKRELEAKVRAEQEAKEAEARAAREAEEQRLAAEKKALEAERARQAEEQRKLDAERARIAAEQRAAEERIRAAEAEAERKRDEAEAAAKAERDRKDAEPLGAPLGTVCRKNDKNLVCPIVTKYYGDPDRKSGGGAVVGHDLGRPLGTITQWDHHALTAAFLMKFYGTSTGSAMDEPLPTITANDRAGGHLAEVRAFLIKYYGADAGQQQSLFDPLHTLTTKARFGLVLVHGEPYQIVDIGMRMLQPRELFSAQGFGPDYIIDFEHNGKRITKSEQTELVGNSQSPDVAYRHARANTIGEAA